MPADKPERVAQLTLTRSEWNALISAASVGAMALRGDKVPRLWVTIAERHLENVGEWNVLMRRIEAIGRAAFPDQGHATTGPRPR